ncbi:MAG: hypothetical protein ABR607_13605 [Pyrinomonadaceae bacterium]
MKLTIATLIVAIAALAAYAQAPTLQIVTSDPNLPSDLFYGNVRVKPLRVRPGTNPPQFITIDDADFFTQEQYIDFLSRMPDSSGFQFWLAQITGCGNNAACIGPQRVNTSGAFFLSIEFQETGYLVERMYKAAYGDANQQSTFGGSHPIAVPVIRFSEFVPDVKQIGNGVIVNQGQWQQQLEANKVAFSQAFVQRSTFTSAYPPAATTPTAFVDALFQKVGVTPSATDRTTAIGEFSGAANISDVAARGRALRDVAENATLQQNEFNRAFVLMQYFGYLRRDPNSGQDTDYTGYDFWLTKLNQFNGSFINAEMVKAFIESSEYRGRF